MAGPVTYEVLRPHLGDRPYKKGEQRELSAAHAEHLVRRGVLRPTGGPAAETEDLPDFRKAEERPLNKVESVAPKNKSRSIKDFD